MAYDYDYEDGLRDHCVNDPLWAADEIESLREELQQMRNAFIDMTQYKQIKTYYGYK